MNNNCTKYLSTLREAKSTPYLHPFDSNSKSSKNYKGCRCYSVTHLSLKDANHETIEKPKKIFFNAGCSSSSTDINRLMQFYNDSADLDVVAHWIKVYEEHKLKTKGDANDNNNMMDDNFKEVFEGENYEKKNMRYGSFDSFDSDYDGFSMSLQKYKSRCNCHKKNLSEEGNFLKKIAHNGNDFEEENVYCSKCSFNDKRRFSTGYSANNRSLDSFTQPTTSKIPFKLSDDSSNLEKCASADFRCNKEKIIERKLERCREMLNISSIADDTNLRL
uniref:Uncharacterized protein n=1 Tax=Strongyloides papillosus TaxID=174720 RepID=A0A0N5BH35_STREA